MGRWLRLSYFLPYIFEHNELRDAEGDNSAKINVNDNRYKHSQRAQQVSVKKKFA